MTPVAFGLFDWLDRGPAPLHQLSEERLQLLEAADAAGFFGYHLAEHHATHLGMAPSPAPFLTAAAQLPSRGPRPGGGRPPAGGPVLAGIGGAPTRARPAKRPRGGTQGGHPPPGVRGGHRRGMDGYARGPRG